MQQPPEGQPQPPPPEGQPQPQPPQQPYYPPQQQQQYGGPPQYQQQPMYQPPPPKKKSKLVLWIVLGVLGVLLLGCVGVVALVALATKSVTTSVVATYTASSSNPAATGQHFKVGEVIKVGDTWQVTVNSAKTSQGDDINKPKAGSHFVVVDVSLKNLSAQEQHVSSALNFSLQDATGQKYTETILSTATPPDGKVGAGSLLRGQLAYETPQNIHIFTFTFEENVIASGQTVWDIKL